MKEKSDMTSAALYMQAGMCNTKGSLATVCSTTFNEKVAGNALRTFSPAA